MRLRQLLKQNAMKEEAALLGAGSLQGVPEQDLQVTLCFAQEDKVWNLNSPRAEDVGSGVQVPAIRRLLLNNWYLQRATVQDECFRQAAVKAS